MGIGFKFVFVHCNCFWGLSKQSFHIISPLSSSSVKGFLIWTILLKVGGNSSSFDHLAASHRAVPRKGGKSSEEEGWWQQMSGIGRSLEVHSSHYFLMQHHTYRHTSREKLHTSETAFFSRLIRLFSLVFVCAHRSSHITIIYSNTNEQILYQNDNSMTACLPKGRTNRFLSWSQNKLRIQPFNSEFLFYLSCRCNISA